MPEYVLLYNRLTQQNIGPEVPPATVIGEEPQKALKAVFGYAFRRVYGEAAKSPDIVLVEGTVDENGTIHKKKYADRRSYIATKKVAEREVKRSEDSYKKKARHPETHRFIRYKR